MNIVKQCYLLREFGFLTCSEYGYERSSKDDEGTKIPNNYCANCGAKIQGEKKIND